MGKKKTVGRISVDEQVGDRQKNGCRVGRADRMTVPGIRREMTVVHNQQPHLVPPMKLVFYDEMPSTPNAPDRSSEMSEWPTIRGSLSRPSSVKSQRVLRKRRTTLVGRRPPARAISPIQRIPAFRPLQLSIYLPSNRLSDLPEFNLAEFNSTGEITLPPKALTRAKSEANLPQITSATSPRKAQSMVDWRPRAAAQATDPVPEMPGYPMQRQSVTWNSLPGLAPTAHEPTMSGAVARPRTPRATSTAQEPLQDSVRLTFPPIDREDGASETAPVVAKPSAAHFPKPPTAVTPPRTAATARSLYGQTTPNTRVSQWLERSNTSSTVSSTSTTPRRSRKAPPSKLSISAPIPIQPPEHIRTTTISSLTSSQGAASHVASVHMAMNSPPRPTYHERTTTMSSLTPSNAPSQQGSKHSRNRTTSSSTIASTALSSLLNNADAASLSSYTTMTTSPPPTSLRGQKAALMPALPLNANVITSPNMTTVPAPASQPIVAATMASVPLATMKDDSVITIVPVPTNDEAERDTSKPQQPSTLTTTTNIPQEQETSFSPASSTSSDSSGPITPPRQRMLAQQAANPSLAHKTGKGSSGSHWGYLPKQYAEVWKRETIVSENDVGVAF